MEHTPNKPILPWMRPALLALFALAVAGLLLSGRRRARALAPAAAAVGIGTAAFWAGYAFSSFGTTESPRYFVPLVPGAVLFTATGLAEFVRAAAERRSRPIAAAAVAVAGAAAYAGLELRLALPLLRSIRQGSEVRQADYRRWPDVPGLDRPAFADYIHFPANCVDIHICRSTVLHFRLIQHTKDLPLQDLRSKRGNILRPHHSARSGKGDQLLCLRMNVGHICSGHGEKDIQGLLRNPDLLSAKLS